MNSQPMQEKRPEDEHVIEYDGALEDMVVLLVRDDQKTIYPLWPFADWVEEYGDKAHEDDAPVLFEYITAVLEVINDVLPEKLIGIVDQSTLKEDWMKHIGGVDDE